MPSLLRGLPTQERDFIGDHALTILRASDGSLEGLLQGIARFQDGLEYGWEEAILDDKWYRWPGEIRKQIFCSEKALTTFLLLKTMGIPAHYAVVENYQNTGLSHEMIYTPGERSYLLDWQDVMPAKVEGKKIVNKKTGKKQKSVWIADDDVIPRVIQARQGESFLDALHCGQVLYRRETPNGEVECRVQYNPQFSELGFFYLFYPSYAAPGFYAQFWFNVEDGKLERSEDLGILIGEHLGDIQGTTYQNRNIDPIAAQDEDIRRTLALMLIYDAKTAKEGGFFCSDQKLDEVIALCRDAAKKPEDPLGKHYRSLLEAYDDPRRIKEKERVKRFFDFDYFKSMAALEFPTIDGLEHFLDHACGIGNHKAQMFWHLAIVGRELSSVVTKSYALQAQAQLCNTLAGKTGVPFQEVQPPHFFQTIEACRNGIV